MTGGGRAAGRAIKQRFYLKGSPKTQISSLYRPLFGTATSQCIKRAQWRHCFLTTPACVLSLSFSFLRLLSFAQKVTMAILALYSPMISPPAALRLSAPLSRATVL
jgi:hypothetical protein